MHVMVWIIIERSDTIERRKHISGEGTIAYI